MHGIDLEMASDLSVALVGWSSDVDQSIAQLTAAATLSELAVGTISALSSVSATLGATGSAVRDAADRLRAHRLRVDPPPSRVGQWARFAPGGMPRDERAFEEFIQRQRRAAVGELSALDEVLRGHGSAGPPGSWSVPVTSRATDALHVLVGDRAVAGAGVALWNAGLSLTRVLLLEDRSDVNAVYEQLVTTMVGGRAPAADGFAAELFPAGYATWAAQRQANPFAQLHLAGPGEVSWRSADPPNRFEATVSLGAHLGGLAGEWAGAQLAGHMENARHPDPDVGPILAGDRTMALGFFNTLGASGAIGILHRFVGDAVPGWEPALAVAPFAAALASVSGDDRLKFSGAALIDADSRTGRVVPAEAYLSAAGFADEFLISATLASLARGTEAGPPLDPTHMTDGDPRQLALWSIALHHAGPSFVTELLEHGRLDDFLVEHHRTGPSAEMDARQLILAQVAADQAVSERLLWAVSALPEISTRRIGQPELASAFGSLLALSLPTLVGNSAAEAVAADVNQLVARSGAGNELRFAGAAFARQLTQGQLYAQPQTIDDISGLLRRLEDARAAIHAEDAAARASAQAQIDLVYDLGSVFVSGASLLAPSWPLLGVAGLVLAAFGLINSLAGSGEEPHPLAGWAEVRELAIEEAMIEIFADRDVSSPYGDPLELFRSPDGRLFVVNPRSGFALRVEFNTLPLNPYLQIVNRDTGEVEHLRTLLAPAVSAVTIAEDEHLPRTGWIPMFFPRSDLSELSDVEPPEQP